MALPTRNRSPILTVDFVDTAGDVKAGIVSDREVYRAACELMLEHGTEAAVYAIDRAREMADRNVAEGALLWMRIARAVGLLVRERGPADTLN